MFAHLFNCSEAVAQHQSAPLLNERLRYLRHCQDVGSPRGTLRRKAHELLVIIDQMNLEPEGAIHSEDIEAAARRWAYRQPQPLQTERPGKSQKTFLPDGQEMVRVFGPTAEATHPGVSEFHRRVRQLHGTRERSFEYDHSQ